MVRPFFELNRFRGSPVSDDKRRTAGLDPAAVDDPHAIIPWPVAEAAIAMSVEVTGRDDMGPAAAVFLQDEVFDVPEYAARHKATLGEGLATVERFAPLLGDGIRWELVREGARAHALFSTSGRSNHPVVLSYGVACMMVVGRRLAGRPLPAPQVELTCPPPKCMEAFETVFACPIRFGASRNCLTFDAEILQWPIQQPNSALAASLERVAEQMLAAHGADASLVEEVRGRVLDLLPQGECAITRVAELLDVPERTLRHRLKDEGTTFSKLVDTTRLELAERYLRDTELTVAEIGYLLGFSTAQAFVRFFKRNHGTTPLSFRRAVRSSST